MVKTRVTLYFDLSLIDIIRLIELWVCGQILDLKTQYSYSELGDKFETLFICENKILKYTLFIAINIRSRVNGYSLRSYTLTPLLNCQTLAKHRK